MARQSSSNKTWIFRLLKRSKQRGGLHKNLNAIHSRAIFTRFFPNENFSPERRIDRNRFHRLYLLPVCRFAILISTGHPTCNYGHLKALATCTLVCKQFQTRPGPVSRINGLTFNYQSTRGHCSIPPSPLPPLPSFSLIVRND